MTKDKSYTSIEIIRDNSVVTVKLNKPEIHNAFNEVLISELSDCFWDLGDDESVRVIVLTGEGKSFCAGADIAWMKSMVGFDFDENIYGQSLQIQFHEWMRYEKMFNSLEELREQLETDKREVLLLFNTF